MKGRIRESHPAFHPAVHLRSSRPSAVKFIPSANLTENRKSRFLISLPSSSSVSSCSKTGSRGRTSRSMAVIWNFRFEIFEGSTALRPAALGSLPCVPCIPWFSSGCSFPGGSNFVLFRGLSRLNKIAPRSGGHRLVEGWTHRLTHGNRVACRKRQQGCRTPRAAPR